MFTNWAKLEVVLKGPDNVFCHVRKLPLTNSKWDGTAKEIIESALINVNYDFKVHNKISLWTWMGMKLHSRGYFVVQHSWVWLVGCSVISPATPTTSTDARPFQNQLCHNEIERPFLCLSNDDFTDHLDEVWSCCDNLTKVLWHQVWCVWFKISSIYMEISKF